MMPVDQLTAPDKGLTSPKLRAQGVKAPTAPASYESAEAKPLLLGARQAEPQPALWSHSVWLIIALNALLALSYCSIVSVIALFVNKALGYTEDQSSFVTNTFNFANFLLAVVGGLMADMK
jgi:sugar phosphate permease